VLFGVSHHGVFSVLSSVNHVAPGGVSMVCRLLVMSGVVVLGGFAVVAVLDCPDHPLGNGAEKNRRGGNETGPKWFRLWQHY
jgi:hypothetical protein